MENTVLPVIPESELDKSIDKLAAITIENFKKKCVTIGVRDWFLDKLKTRIEDHKHHKQK